MRILNKKYVSVQWTILPFTFFLFTGITFSQERPDTLYTEPELNHYLQLQSKLDQLDFYLDLKSADMEMMFTGDKNSIWLWTYQSLKQTNGGSSEKMPSHISLPLYRQYLANSKFDPVKTILGMAEAGAVGYLAYRSIKKYGFIK